MKSFLVGCGILAAGIAAAQIPTIHVGLDLTGSYLIQQGATSRFNLYDIMGRPSTVSLWFYTEQGFRAYVAERLQRLPGDKGSDLFDEYYFEDEGIWRAGKQYLPFGEGKILHESAIAARGDTNLIVEGFPMSVALCDSGAGLESGVIGRIGNMYGISAAIGRHFGISGTSLDDVRLPSAAPGAGRGWKQVYGADFSHRFGRLMLRAEGAAFRGGETVLDQDLTVVDVSVTEEPRRGESWTVGWSRSLPDANDYYRVGGSFAVYKNVSFEPMLRFRDSSFFDLALELRIRI